MLSTKDIRIGNIVKHNSDYYEVFGIDDELKVIYLKDLTDSKRIFLETKEINRIKLTDTILENLGFMQIKEFLFTKQNKDEDFVMAIDKLNENNFVENTLNRRIRYLDELQNLYYFLSFEELKFKNTK